MKGPAAWFNLLRLVERSAAWAQGKGYGTRSLEDEARLLESFLTQPPRLAIDVGGNVGGYTAAWRARHPALEIHTFEPAATNVDRLRSRFEVDPLVTIVPLALSDHAGSATLYANRPGSGLGSLTRRRLDHFDIPFDVEETVSTLRFEDYWRQQLNARPIDLVKLDVEGHELAVLDGFGEALQATRALQFEFGGCNIDTRTFFQDFWYFFRDRGFELYRRTPFGPALVSRYRESEEYFSTTNYVAVNRR